MIFLTSCSDYKVQPIEKYQNKGIVIVDDPESIVTDSKDYMARCKTKDSIFYIRIPITNLKNFKS